MDSERFQITRTERTTQGLTATVKILDEQIEELENETSRLKDLRAHVARTIGMNRNGKTRMEKILDGAERSVREGKSEDIGKELSAETERQLGGLIIDADITGQIPE